MALNNSTITIINDTSDPISGIFGITLPPPEPPTSPALTGQAPTVSSTPTPGQGIATDGSGRLPVSVAVQKVVVTTSDPTSPVIGQMWYRQDTKQLSIRHDAGTTVRVTLA